MNLPDHIQAEIAKGPVSVAGRDALGSPTIGKETPQEFAARIARMVATHCMELAETAACIP